MRTDVSLSVVVQLDGAEVSALNRLLGNMSVKKSQEIGLEKDEIETLCGISAALSAALEESFISS